LNVFGWQAVDLSPAIYRRFVFRNQPTQRSRDKFALSSLARAALNLSVIVSVVEAPAFVFMSLRLTNPPCPIHFALFAKWVGKHIPQPARRREAGVSIPAKIVVLFLEINPRDEVAIV
jgi:hypothetical protein